MPLPLYGSGGRHLRIWAAISPTCCLEMPRTTTCVGAGTSNVIPSGAFTLDRMAESQLHLQVGAAQRRPVADALDLEAALVTHR